FEDQALRLRQFHVPGNRDGLADWIYSAQALFASFVNALDDGDLTELRPALYGPHLPIHWLVSGIAVEHIHHGAEIGLLRDLRRGHARLANQARTAVAVTSSDRFKCREEPASRARDTES